jgi:hypothetical protein
METSATGTTFYIRGPHGELLTEWQDPSTDWTARDYVYVGSRMIASITK